MGYPHDYGNPHIIHLTSTKHDGGAASRRLADLASGGWGWGTLEIPGLVNVDITNWKITILLMGKSMKIHDFDWAMASMSQTLSHYQAGYGLFWSTRKADFGESSDISSRELDLSNVRISTSKHEAFSQQNRIARACAFDLQLWPFDQAIYSLLWREHPQKRRKPMAWSSRLSRLVIAKHPSHRWMF